MTADTMTRPAKPAPITDDLATLYARSVTEGTAPAGPHVRAACTRHLQDLEHGAARGLAWSVEKANRAISFFRDVLHLAGGIHEGESFMPAPWQCFVLGSLFGWLGSDGHRRFRMAFVEAGKGSGKSPLAAGIGLYMLTADGESRAEVYACASKKDQAMVLFRDAVAMVRQSPALMARLQFSGGQQREWNIAHLSTGSFFRPISSDDGQSGPRPHLALLDEIHEHKDSSVVEMMRAGTKGRTQALIFMITNSGVDRTSVCYQYHEYGARVAAGLAEDDSFFSYICGLDEADDPFTSEECWLKANPTLGITIPPKYLREQVVQARGMPAKESIVRRLNFCQWVDAATPWISGELWRACEVEQDAEEFLAEVEQERCFLALDLSGTRDLTAAAAVWPMDDDRVRAAVWFWSPGDSLAERSREQRVPYDVWARQGWLEAPPGRAVDYAHVAEWLGTFTARFNVVSCAYDPYRIKYLEVELARAGVQLDLVPHGQGYFRAKDSGLWMPRSVELLEQAVMARRLEVLANPVLSWNSASAVLLADAKGSRVFEKRKSAGKIDGIVALAMAVGVAGETDTFDDDLADFFANPITF